MGKAKNHFHYVIMNHIPDQGGGSPQEWNKILEEGFRTSFPTEMTAREKSLWNKTIQSAENLSAVERKGLDSLIEKLDAFILFQAETLGWRVVLSTTVQWRMSAWAQIPGGPEKFKALGKAMALAARRLQREKPTPLSDPGLYAHKQTATEELKVLFRKLSAAARQQNRLSAADATAWFRTQVEQHPDQFPNLSVNLEALLNYLADPNLYPRLPIDPLRNGEKVSPAIFFDEWMGWCTKRDPEKLRQAISRIGSTKRRVI